MTHAYSADALVRGADGSYALRPDFAPERHRVEVAFAGAAPWELAFDDAWHGNTDPPRAEIRNTAGTVATAGHAYIADRVSLTCGRNGRPVHVEILAMEAETVAFVTDRPLIAGQFYHEIDGDFAHDASDVDGAAAISGFGRGTRILTQDGLLPVEWVAPGDRVVTYDRGLQPLRWIGVAGVSDRRLADQPTLRPVNCRAGAVDGAVPDESLTLAPDTELLLSGAEVQLHFGCDRVLARVGDILDPAVRTPALGGLAYFQLGFDRHEVVNANGAWCAAPFLAADRTVATAGDAPPPPPGLRHQRTAHPVLNPWEARLWRTLRNRRGKGVSRAA